MKTAHRRVYVYFVLAFLGLMQLSFSPSLVHAQAAQAQNSESDVMSSFNAEEAERANKGAVDDSVKHKVLFWMGLVLLVLVIATAVVGVNMAFFGKEVFVAHMVLAGGTVFLSIAHAVTAVVWFFPF